MAVWSIGMNIIQPKSLPHSLWVFVARDQYQCPTCSINAAMRLKTMMAPWRFLDSFALSSCREHIHVQTNRHGYSQKPRVDGALVNTTNDLLLISHGSGSSTASS